MRDAYPQLQEDVEEVVMCFEIGAMNLKTAVRGSLELGYRRAMEAQKGKKTNDHDN